MGRIKLLPQRKQLDLMVGCGAEEGHQLPLQCQRYMQRQCITGNNKSALINNACKLPWIDLRSTSVNGREL